MGVSFLKQNVSNKFWSEVFECWAYDGKELRMNSNSDVMQPCLRNNRYISENQMFLPLWFKKVSIQLVILQIYLAKY